MKLEAPLRREQSLLLYIWREFVHGGHLLALGTSSIAAASALLMGFTPTLPLLVTAYLFTYGAYTINRSSDFEQDSISHPERTKFLEKRKKYLPYVAGFSFAIGYSIAILTNIPFFFALLAPLALALIYSVSSKTLFRAIGASRLKEKLLVKNITISLGWSLIPLLVGFYYERFTSVILILAPFIFLRFLESTIFFDTRDTKGDKASGIRTIPTVFGVSKAFSIMDVADLVSGLYLIALISLRVLPFFASVMLIFPIYSLIYRALALRFPSRLNFLCDVVCDGEYILWGAVLVLGRILI
jgi:4-hydroxybenzoate polyprenyltransferase